MMLIDTETFKDVVFTVIQLIKSEGDTSLAKLIQNGHVSIKCSRAVSFPGDTSLYEVYITTDVESFLSIKDSIEYYEKYLLEKFDTSTRNYQNDAITKVVLLPKETINIDWSRINGISSQKDLLDDINRLKSYLISISTGGDRIQDVNDIYKNIFFRVNKCLTLLEIHNPNTYLDLWQWYEEYKSRFSTYAERREHITKLYAITISELMEAKKPEIVKIAVDLDEWSKIKRTINEIELLSQRLNKEENCQSLGLLCREVIISLAQVVFDPSKHIVTDVSSVSKTDSKRMLEAYINLELSGSTNETLRKFARATVDLANELTHKRTATKKDALLCKSATISLINFIGIIDEKF